MSSEERWKVIEEFPRYEVSDLGRVRHVQRQKPRKLQQNSYTWVGIWKDGRLRTVLVHVLMAKAFISNPHNLPFVDHINRNRHDNRLCNLRWISARNNCYNTTYCRGKLGVIGVTKSRNKFIARIGRSNKYLGTFNTIEEAELARLKAEHEIAGEFMTDVRKKRLDFLLSQTT